MHPPTPSLELLAVSARLWGFPSFFIFFLYMGSMAQCINTSEWGSQCFVHGSLYDLLSIMSIICHFLFPLGIRYQIVEYICKYHELFSNARHWISTYNIKSKIVSESVIAEQKEQEQSAQTRCENK
jgi:hypothetical protein